MGADLTTPPRVRMYAHCRLFDGTGTSTSPDAALLVDHTRISWVGPASAAPAIDPAAVVDLNGRCVVPGLINMHDHITWRRGTESFEERVLRRPMVELLARGAGQALVSLLEGETTVRDCASKQGTAIVLRDAIERGELRGPRIFSVGSAIGITGGHASSRPFAPDGEAVVAADGVDAVLKATRQQLHLGADWIKLLVSGGFLLPDIDQPDAQQFSLPEMQAAFDEAHRAGKPTTAHAHPPTAIATAIEAGADCIEHAGLADRATVELMAKRGTYVSPTLSFLRYELELADRVGRRDWLVEKMRAHLDSQAQIFGWFREAHVPIVPGTDGNGDLQHELRYMVDLGMTPAEAIISATAVSATCLRMGDKLGTLEAGKLADFVVLDGNPLTDIRDLQNVYLTVKDGQAYSPAVLRESIGHRQPSEHLGNIVLAQVGG